MKKGSQSKAAKTKAQPKIRHERFTGTASEIALPEERIVDLSTRAKKR